MGEHRGEFGGYLPLELAPFSGEYHENGPEWQVERLNSGRSAFYFAAISARATRVFLPHFTCIDVAEPFIELGIDIERYLLDGDLLPKDVSPRKNEIVVWTNYYGNATREAINSVSQQFAGRLIIDNCHAFFSPPERGAFNAYSARKFFGVSDGGYLVAENIEIPPDVPRDNSHSSLTHLALQLDQGTNAGYRHSIENETRLGKKFLRMSRFSGKLLGSINYESVQSVRTANFRVLHQLLESRNEFDINLSSETHMYYPFLHADPELRNRLVQRQVYNPHWWAHVPESVPVSSIEAFLSSNMVMLPIDQRYSREDMEQLASIVLEEMRP